MERSRVWRWMLNGLGGLVQMIVAHEKEDDVPMTAEQFQQLEEYIGDLKKISSRQQRRMQS